MALTYQLYAGRNNISDAIQIAKHGNIKIYYVDDPIDVLKDHDQEDALHLVSELVDETVRDLRAIHVPSSRLNNLDCDIYSKSCPPNRLDRRIFNQVKDKLAAMESKIYKTSQGEITIIPRKIEGQRDGLYITGTSGSGKSVFCSNFALNYQLENPGNRVFLISRKSYDKAFDDVVPDLIRIKPDRQFTNSLRSTEERDEPIEQFHDSLVIFDDFEGIHDTSIRKAIVGLKDDIFRLGRQFNISVCSIQHKSLGGSNSMVDLFESNIIVCFPRNNLNECIKLLTQYCCCSRAQIERIFDDDTKLERWLCVIRPNIFITQHSIRIID